jgi:hypothetical protein
MILTDENDIVFFMLVNTEGITNENQEVKKMGEVFPRYFHRKI